MQLTRVQALSRHIGGSSRLSHAPFGKQKMRSIKVKQSGSYPFDLSSMKEVSTPKNTGLFTRIERFFTPERKEVILPNLDEFMRPNPAGRFPNQPLTTPFPNPFTKQKYSSPMLLRTSENPDPPSQEIKDPIMKKLRLLFCLKGRLCRNQQGFYFIKLPDLILGTLFPYINRIDAQIPDHFTFIDHLGAHIPVIMPNETFDFGKTPNELGETFYFAIKGLYSKEVSNYPGVSKIWFLTFTSYDLEWLRQKHGLTSSLAGEAFHCIIGSKPMENSKPVKETFRISPLVESA